MTTFFTPDDPEWSAASVRTFAILDYADELVWTDPRQLAKYLRFRSWLDAYKTERGCVDCGYNAHPAALEFDHVGDLDKINRVGAMYSWSKKKIMEEIAKCELRCSNCHRIKTFERGQHRGHPGRGGWKRAS